jgi:Lrp/AsnC family transcriptional regulator, regulator for asnA, asnC and gidA
MIDNLNQEIINLLKQDGRYSCAKLAKELGVNVATITKRIDRMQEEDVFSIKTVLNPFRFKFNTHALITLDVELNKINQVCSRLVDNPNISLVATIYGRYDIMIIADLLTWEMMQEFITGELPKIEGINEINTFPIIEIKKIYLGIFKYFDSSGNIPPKIDEIDSKIIEELGNNGRLSFADLSKKLDISLTTVSRRVAHLKDEDLIKIIAVRNPAKWGYFANSYFVLCADLNKVNAICDKLSKIPEVHLIATLMSGYEILAGIYSANLEVMYKFIIDKVAQIDGVANIETFVCAEIRKRSFAMFEPDEK